MPLVAKAISGLALIAALGLAAATANATAPAPTPRPTTAAPTTAAPTTAPRPPATAPATAQPPAAAAAPAAGPTEISEARLALAKQVMKNAPQIGDFNGILPDLMQDTKSRLITLRPDLYRQISTIVETTASSLVPRRNDLDSDIARVWARAFTDDELKAINAFFGSPTGQKYKAVAPQVGNDIVKAGQNWADRVAGEMFDKSLAELKKQFKF